MLNQYIVHMKGGVKVETMTLKAIRTNLNWSLEKASKKLGVSKDTLSKWERGKSYPNIPRLKRIEQTYNVQYSCINFLLNDTD